MKTDLSDVQKGDTLILEYRSSPKAKVKTSVIDVEKRTTKRVVVGEYYNTRTFNLDGAPCFKISRAFKLRLPKPGEVEQITKEAEEAVEEQERE